MYTASMLKWIIQPCMFIVLFLVNNLRHVFETTATIEVDQVLLAFQQLANNSNSANFNNNFRTISKLSKSLTTTMPTFDGKSEKFDLFEELFQRSLKIHNQLTEDERINYFHSLMRQKRYRHSKILTTQPERIWEKSWQFFVGYT